MNKIKVLNKNLIGLVAAGEVIERPASVVKELVENSIDAGAKKIIIKIQDGGKKFISISDDGCGILRDDVKIAFLNHATSKLNSHEELLELSTLGFRGEALASISAVSKIKIHTKTKNEKIGTKLKIIASKSSDVSDFPMTTGTFIEVEDLFFNIPARLKFLKKNSTETSYVSAIVEKLALSHPEISFTFIKEGKESLKTYGDGKIISVILSVVGRAFLEKSLNLDYEFNNIKIKGLVGLPSIAKTSKIYQIFFVNGRSVKIPVASNAFDEFFSNEIPNGKVIPCVVYINTPIGFVDVNVSPSKTEVKFIDEDLIFEAILNSIKSAFKNYEDKSFIKIQENPIKKEFDDNKNDYYENIKTDNFNNNFKKQNINENLFKPNFDINLINKSYDNDLKYFPHKQDFEIFENIKIEQNKPNIKIIGEIFGCYILGQINNEVILIDKHAAHERIIYEFIKTKDKNNYSQKLIKPITGKFENIEYDTIISNLKIFFNLGYEIEEFGENKIIIRSIPIHLQICDVENSITEISSYINKNKKNLNINSINALYSKIACKSALKAGKFSNQNQINSIIKLLEKFQVIHCPHGRPIFTYIKKSEIDKYFYRY